ncbi:MAG TPA: ATP-binding protein [Gemmatimonadaceae bacterium]|nr:ATP-binding protein [Gemmatimonadaceae bacterium]
MPTIPRNSLRWRLPTLITGLLLAALAVFGALAYSSARRVTTAAAFARLTSVAQQFAQLLGTSAQTRLREVAAVADNPALRAALHARSTAGDAAVRTALRPLGAGAQMRAVELRDSAGHTVVALDQPAALRGATPLPAKPAVLPFFARDDSVFYEVSAPVREGDRVIGYVVELHRLLTNGQNVQSLTSLVGSGSIMLIGNADGALWTDFQRPVHRSAIPTEGTEYTHDSARWLAASAAMRAAPWAIALEFPRDQVLAPVRSLVERLALVGVLVLAIGIVATWWLSRRITLPLGALTQAAEAIAGGTLSAEPPVIERADEIGRLGRSFSRMAESVRDAHDNLERQIAERTAELEHTVVQLRDAQDELVRKERLAILGQLSSGVGHELRNPLGVMTNAIYYLNATLTDAPPKVKEYLDILRTQVTLSERIVSDLLDFARVKPPQRMPVHLSDLLDLQLDRMAVPDSVRVERDIPPNLPLANVDPVQIGQVVLNLLTNAVQAMDGSGVLTLRAQATDGRVSLQVTDSGPGIPPENLGKIFEPLFTTKARGIGLGLSVSRTLARANDGEITAANGPGRGATFSLELPAQAHRA